MRDFYNEIEAIQHTTPTHPGNRNPKYLDKNHPIRYVLDHAATTRTHEDNGTPITFDYSGHLEEAGFSKQTELVQRAVTAIQELRAEGQHDAAQEAADNYIAEIAENHLTANERIAR